VLYNISKIRNLTVFVWGGADTADGLLAVMLESLYNSSSSSSSSSVLSQCKLRTSLLLTVSNFLPEAFNQLQLDGMVHASIRNQRGATNQGQAATNYGEGATNYGGEGATKYEYRAAPLISLRTYIHFQGMHY
jgi:hypothetical protein